MIINNGDVSDLDRSQRIDETNNIINVSILIRKLMYKGYHDLIIET